MSITIIPMQCMHRFPSKPLRHNNINTSCNQVWHKVYWLGWSIFRNQTIERYKLFAYNRSIITDARKRHRWWNLQKKCSRCSPHYLNLLKMQQYAFSWLSLSCNIVHVLCSFSWENEYLVHLMSENLFTFKVCKNCVCFPLKLWIVIE